MTDGGYDFVVPDLGEGLEELTLVSWLVERGDAVELNQPLCLVETEKAEVEIPSPTAGVVVELGGDVGETLRVGTLLTRFAPGSPAESPVEEQQESRRTPTLVGYGPDEAVDRSRRAARSTEPDVATTVPSARVAAGGVHTLAKPPVRKLARTLGVDLATLAPGSGSGGIVTRADVEAAAATGRGTRPGAPVERSGDDELIPVRGVRARIAEHLTESRTRIPDATCSVVAECTALLATRATLNDAVTRLGREPAITPFSLICAFLVRTLGANPTFNATYLEDREDGPAIRRHRGVHLGVGAATSRGLLVPVIRDADRRSLLDLSGELARLRDAARDGSLTPAELRGSTFTVSNFGALGLDDGIPIVNSPEAAILGVGSIRLRPHVVDGVVVARPTTTLTLAFDHRVGDGAEAAALLVDLRELIEAPELAILFE